MAAAAVRALHAAPRFVSDFDMFEIQPRYYRAARSGGMAVPAGYDDLAPAFAAARAALAARAEGTVPCNNDLLAANFIDDGERIALIDYEYSGNNDPCFELGNIAGECGLSADALADLVTAYYGRRRPRPDRPGAPVHPGVAVRVDAVGRHPAREQPAGLRLLVLGHGALRGRRGRLHQPRASSGCSTDVQEGD